MTHPFIKSITWVPARPDTHSNWVEAQLTADKVGRAIHAKVDGKEQMVYPAKNEGNPA